MMDRIMLGLGGTVDYEIVWDSATIEALVLEHGIRAAELSTTVPVDSVRNLLVTVLAFVRDGVGGERFVASSDVVEDFAARFDSRTTLGGTGVRGALAMATLGVRSTVHLVSIDDHVRRLLPPTIASLCSAQEDSFDPHLIVQFPAGARVRAGDLDLRAPHPNRLIYAHDPPNRELRLHPDLGTSLSRAEIFLVSGFNSIQDPALLARRLAELRAHMSRLPAGALTFYEDAGFHVPALREAVIDGFLDLVDVYSMNEDEMQSSLARRVDLLDADDVTEALVELHAAVPARLLVVHTKYWSAALGRDAQRYRAALQGGITMASTRYVVGDGFDAVDYEAVGRSPVHPLGAAVVDAVRSRLTNRPGTTDRSADHEFCGVPAFVLTTPTPTTIGLGDTFVGGFIAALAVAAP
ncbi:ADP-dependent glucokinase/phosphofructokinase [Oerskovia flava]|uniref:ADP-dependent glucokinase/phosphofructokinase n=1 Tax=Oerskovia flava TaxID=2986422 RepID=UPI00223F2C1E|nr:ADP-dependent glucokinase/phosphofructokinase [Oerskovia sp. JB1-3-2]